MKESKLYIECVDELAKEYKFIKAISDYAQEGETSSFVLVWAYLSGAAALMGRHFYFNLGSAGKLFPNLFIVISGESGAKKTTALEVVRGLITKHKLPVVFAPDDVAGQAKSLMASMLAMQNIVQASIEKSNREEEESKRRQSGLLLEEQHPVQSFDLLAPPSNELFQEEEAPLIDPAVFAHYGRDFDYTKLQLCDYNAVYCMPDEFITLMTSKGSSIGKFLTATYNGGAYSYAHNKTIQVIKEPLTNLIGTTQPKVLEEVLLEQALRDGFIGRTIFIYAPTTNRMVAFPPDGSVSCLEAAGEAYKLVSNNRGELTISAEARKEYTKLYTQNRTWVDDSRYLNYNSKRCHHLLKVAMILCALDNRKEVRKIDIELSHTLLLAAESQMQHCLGYFGQGKEAPLLNEILRWMTSLGIDENRKTVTMADMFNQFSHLGTQGVIASAIQVLRGKKLIVSVVDAKSGREEFILNEGVDNADDFAI